MKRSHTYAAARPSTGSRPSSSGTPSAGPPATTRCGWNAPRTTRSSGPASGPTIATSLDVGEVEVERLQQVPERGRVLWGDRVQEPQHAERRLLVGVFARERGEPQQAVRGRGGAGRDRRVLELLAPRDQRLVVVGGGEEAAVLGVGARGRQRGVPASRR